MHKFCLKMALISVRDGLQENTTVTSVEDEILHKTQQVS